MKFISLMGAISITLVLVGCATQRVDSDWVKDPEPGYNSQRVELPAFGDIVKWGERLRYIKLRVDCAWYRKVENLPGGWTAKKIAESVGETWILSENKTKYDTPPYVDVQFGFPDADCFGLNLKVGLNKENGEDSGINWERTFRYEANGGAEKWRPSNY